LIGEIDYFTHERHHVVDWYRDDKRIVEKGYSATLLGDAAFRFVEKHDPAAPFFLYLAFNAPDTPYQAPKEYLDRYARVQHRAVNEPLRRRPAERGRKPFRAGGRHPGGHPR
jgi:arylsulfatase A-like enzyme